MNNLIEVLEKPHKRFCLLEYFSCTLFQKILPQIGINYKDIYYLKVDYHQVWYEQGPIIFLICLFLGQLYL